MIYFAPIQGFTDFIYRKAFSAVFPDIDVFFIPYISLKNGQILNKQQREISPENNCQKRVVPQVLVKDENEIIVLSNVLQDLGYHEINLNLGCPFPMVTNRGKGSGLLPHPEKIEILLDTFFEKTNLKLSVKLRAGLVSDKELESVVPVLNKFPLTEVIVHPRIAKQLYKGKISESAFLFAQTHLIHQKVYNGDIFSVEDVNDCKSKFPNVQDWMLGRGVLMNPFLPSAMKGVFFNEEIKYQKLMEFHQLVFEGYSEKMDNQGNVLNKMKQFWSYFSFNFPNQKKTFKKIKKAGSVHNYLAEVQKIFRDGIC